MGHQVSRSQPIIAQERNSCKTSFHYIHPIKCQIEQHLPIQQETIQQVDIKKHQEEYFIIQNNQEELSINSIKDLQKIDEIKVRWNQFIKMKKKNYLEDYSVLKQIGRGGFGCVHKVKARYTGLYRAAKRIKKAQLKKSQHQKLFQQMAIMISLDHPNIAKLYQVYDYKSYYVLILQLCEGGELFKKIVTKQLNQQISARVMKQILWTLIYLHKKGIVHRDLKPQNMLFQQDSDTLKIIDFGIAVKKKPDQVLNSRLGTPYYIAPEVLCKSYNEKCDIWSAGVILFMMISGYPPFRGDNEYEVMENVLKQTVSFKGAIWSKVTSQCKQLISLMLKKNPDERPNAEQAFNHPWLKKVVEKSKISKQQHVIANIRGFSFQNKLQAVVYTYIVSQLLTSQQKKFLFQTFKQLDKNNDGVIESSQLYQALKSKKDVSQERVKFLMRIIDTNGSGHIDYTEFLVAGIDPKNALTQCHFEQAFQYFDIDHSGAITFEQIAHFLQDTKQSQVSIKKIFQQVDQNNDGNISKQQFVKLLMQETKRKMKSLQSIKDGQTDSFDREKNENGQQVKKNTKPRPTIQQNIFKQVKKDVQKDISKATQIRAKRASKQIFNQIQKPQKIKQVKQSQKSKPPTNQLLNKQKQLKVRLSQIKTQLKQKNNKQTPNFKQSQNGKYKQQKQGNIKVNIKENVNINIENEKDKGMKPNKYFLYKICKF